MEKENIWSAEEKKSEKGKRGKYLVRGGRDTVEGKGRKYFGEGKIVGQKEERIGSIFYFKFTFFSNEYSLPCLVVGRMEELIVELSVENVWCSWERRSFMHLSHRGMVGFGLHAKFGDNWKKALLPPSSTSEGQKGTGDDDDDLL